jgi:DMSO/TMAO reductase YedYZ molybdopterin-dependent catalytic subunit
MLLNTLSRPNAARHGVAIRCEPLACKDHQLFFIAEAPDEAGLQAFLAPLREHGDTEIMPASTWAGAVGSHGCNALPPNVSAQAIDPAQACQNAVDAGLLIRSVHPLNGETSIPDLAGGAVMPSRHFYVRNHFAMPNLDGQRYRLSVGGLVERPFEVSLSELQNLPSESRVVTLECAGNGRSLFDPAVLGEPWSLGAVSTAEWTGVPLAELLDRAGLQPSATEIIFRGADGGRIADAEAPIQFERSLSVDRIRDLDALLAYAMNGEPLSVPHGYPLRLIVPGWYAVASVKWLTEIIVTDRAFDGYFQTTKYWYEWVRDGREEREPVTLLNVRALIVAPDAGGTLSRAETAIRGVAWSGAASIAKVEVSLNGGPWQEARMIGERHRGAWQWWELFSTFEKAGPIVIRARATDMAGRTQPDQAEWNRLGYGNNSVHAVAAHVI